MTSVGTGLWKEVSCLCVLKPKLDWKHRPLYLYLRFTMKSYSHFPLCGLSSVHDFFFTYAWLPSNDKYKHAYLKTQSFRNHQICTSSYVFAGFHFLHLGVLKTRFLHIDPFIYRKYILNSFGCLDVSIRVAILNKYKARNFSG